MKAQRLILADDHPIVVDGLSTLFAAQGVQVVAVARDADEAERLALQTPADLLLLDVALPKRSGIRVLESLRRGGCTLPVLFYTMVPVAQYTAYMRRAGAQGVVSKAADAPALLQAVDTVLAGGTAFPAANDDGAGNARGRAGKATTLSPREAEVMQGLLDGHSLVAIAAELGISVPTATTYRRRVLDKLGVASNAELIRLMVV